jgi:hypothetical protein
LIKFVKLKALKKEFCVARDCPDERLLLSWGIGLMTWERLILLLLEAKGVKALLLEWVTMGNVF